MYPHGLSKSVYRSQNFYVQQYVDEGVKPYTYSNTGKIIVNCRKVVQPPDCRNDCDEIVINIIIILQLKSNYYYHFVRHCGAFYWLKWGFWGAKNVFQPDEINQ